MPASTSRSELFTSDRQTLVLLFDGTCGVCTRLARWVRRCDREGRLRVVPNQQVGVLEAAGLRRADVEMAAWAIDRTGRGWAGVAALNRVLEELGGSVGLLAVPFRLPPLAAFEHAIYSAFARHRGGFRRLGVRPECEDPGVDCRSV